MLTEQYEKLRAYVLARNSSSGLRLGQGALMARGMAAWMQVVGELMAPVRSAPSPAGAKASIPLPMQDEVIRLMGGAVMTWCTEDRYESVKPSESSGRTFKPERLPRNREAAQSPAALNQSFLYETIRLAGSGKCGEQPASIWTAGSSAGSGMAAGTDRGHRL